MKNRSLYFFLSFLSFSYFSNAQSNISLAENLAETVMKKYPDSMVVLKFIDHLKQDNLLNGNVQDLITANKNRPADWNYEMGVVLMGFEKLWKTTGNKKYYDYLKHILDHFILDDGTIRTYKQDDFSCDNIPPGRQLITLYQNEHLPKYDIAIATLHNQILWQPRNKVGGFWHKLKYPSQMWLDGLYMIEPFYANYTSLFGDSADYKDIINQFVMMEKYARDSSTGLLFHGWDESKLQKWANKKTGQSPELWSRAIGWFVMALVDVLDYIPINYSRRKELINILNRTAKSILKFQDNATGVWWQITNKPTEKDNYLESSASAMFVYSITKGIRLHYLPDSYLPKIIKGFDGLNTQFVTTDSLGIVHYNKAVSGAGLGGMPYRDGSYNYYVHEPKRDDDLKAIGPFIQACLEMDLFRKK